MKNSLKAVLILFLSMFASICSATETNFSKQLEQQVIADWIVSYTKGRTNQADANFIVKTVYNESEKTKIDPLLIIALISKESTFRKYATSGYGAKGLMQVVPYWHPEKLRKRDPYNRIVSIEVGSKVLWDCLKKRNFNTDLALKCYSGGARNYQTFIQAKHKILATEIVKARFINELPIQSKYSYATPVLKDSNSETNPSTLYAGI